MKELNLKIHKVIVITDRYGPDQISLEIDLPTAFPMMSGYNVFATFQAAGGNGVKWCKEVLNLEPDEIIEING